MSRHSPPEITAKTRAHLEWERITARLAEHCRGPVAAERAAALGFADPPADRDARLERITEARALIDRGQSAPLTDIDDPARSIGLAARGGRVEPEALLDIGRLLDAAARARRFFSSLGEATPRLCAIAEEITEFPELAAALVGTFDEHGAVLDSASGALGGLRARVAVLHEQLKQHVHGLLADPMYEGMLQDDYYTIREDRYVLPIRSGEKRHVPGVVHGYSATGATVYIEPQVVVEANNRLLMAQAEVEQEISRIIDRLSRRVGTAAAGIEATFRAMVALDLAFAGARLSRELEGSPATLTDTPDLHLRAARHPLLVLAGTPVVPNDLVLGAAQRVLVITGPNTGGKTVALKTAGLCTLMALAGLHVPAAPGSRVPRVPGVHTDIGDEQSLHEERSTFSGHVANLLVILRTIRPNALVLLDEIVVGTDPVQGAALAQAILEHLADRQALVLITTHYESLKALPLDDTRFRNGAVGFDVGEGRPTYRLTLDVPGASSALATARRLGVPAPIVDRAASLLGSQRRRLEEAIAALEAERSGLEAERRGAEAERLRLRDAREAAEAHEARLRQRVREGVERERNAALRAARKVRDEMAALEAEMKRPDRRRDVGAIAAAGGRAAAAIAVIAAEQRADRASGAGPALRAVDLKPGARVHLAHLGVDGEFVSGPDDRGRCLVRAGAMQVTVSEGDLRRPGEALEAPGARRGERKSASRADASSRTPDHDVRGGTIDERPQGWAAVPPQTEDLTIDLRGRRADEALGELEQFLDRLYEREASAAYIIHGHGTGALKRDVRQWLRTCRYVTDQRRGDRHEGGDGVTVALLR